MAKRVTIMIDSDLDKEIRLVQSNLIRKHSKSFSYSKMLNQALRSALK